MTSDKIFKPRPSTGWVWVAGLALVLLTAGFGMLITYGFAGPYIITILLTIPMGLAFMLITIFFPAMRYEIKDKQLVLSYGPLLRYTIDIGQIRSIRRRNLGISMLSSFRFPGLAIFGVPYQKIGTVKMCATASGNDILLIETESTRYGVTPANEEEFVNELRARMQR
jgi:hypothetical protein